MMTSLETQSARQERMAVIAQSEPKSLFAHWQKLDMDPIVHLLRGPETGLIALKGRIGGGGSAFNFGETTVTRASVRTEDGALGHAVILGRNHDKAKLAAVIDALCQDEALEKTIEEGLVKPLHQEQETRDARRREETAATKVDFFTLVRGEDE